MKIPENIIEIGSHDALLNVLNQHDIPHQTWGENDTRTSHDLYNEIADGEAAVFLAEQGLQRYCASIKVNIFHKTGSTALHLVEVAQHNVVTGSLRHRGLYNSLSEKQHVFQGEEPLDAALRGMREELRGPDNEQIVTSPLGINLSMHRLWPAKQERNYGGLLSTTETHYYDALLRPEEYRRGYKEKQYDESGNLKRQTFFFWDPARNGLPAAIDV